MGGAFAVLRGDDLAGQWVCQSCGVAKGTSVAGFLGMTTSSVNRMARLEKVTDIAGWDK